MDNVVHRKRELKKIESQGNPLRGRATLIKIGKNL